MHKGSCLERKCDDGVEDRRGDANGDRWTDFSVWDICVVIRGDRKSGWWMGRPARPTGKKKETTKVGPKHEIEEGEEQVMCVRAGEVQPGRTLQERRPVRRGGEGESTRTGCHNGSRALAMMLWTCVTHQGGRAWWEGTGEERGGFKIWGRRRKEKRQPFETLLGSWHQRQRSIWSDDGSPRMQKKDRGLLYSQKYGHGIVHEGEPSQGYVPSLIWKMCFHFLVCILLIFITEQNPPKMTFWGSNESLLPLLFRK